MQEGCGNFAGIPGKNPQLTGIPFAWNVTNAYKENTVCALQKNIWDSFSKASCIHIMKSLLFSFVIVIIIVYT